MAEQKYRVIKRLAAGGMAEVFLGESSSVQGFVKTVAIKRVLPHLCQNPKFIQMFLDEVRLSARLNHANIVTVFDVGASENTYFLVMEYVDGTNLKELLESARKRQRQLEPKQGAYIGIEACRGLSYAHHLSDESGESLHIVHRDISPPNIMITKQGEIKVADFGLAKAGMNVEKTDPGVVKGKFGYLAPEVAYGEEADARSDVFSLGVVIWEMLAGRRLFLGETDFHTVKLVRAANIPRLAPLNRFVDENFEEILLRALARDPARRFQTAQEFGDMLAGYLFEKGLKVTGYDIAALVNGLTSSHQKDPLKDESSMMDRLIEEELVRFTSIDEQPVDDSPSPVPDSPAGGAAWGGDDFENPADWFTSESMLPAPPDAEVAEVAVPAPARMPARVPARAPARAPAIPSGGSNPGKSASGQQQVSHGHGRTGPVEEEVAEEAIAIDIDDDTGPAEELKVAAPPPPAKAKGVGALVMIAAAAIIVAAAGAAAWLGNLLPLP